MNSRQSKRVQNQKKKIAWVYPSLKEYWKKQITWFWCGFPSFFFGSFFLFIIIISGQISNIFLMHSKHVLICWYVFRSSPPEMFLGKRCSEKMQQIYRRTPMSKCDFNKVVLQLYWNYTSACVLFCKFAAHILNTFL